MTETEADHSKTYAEVGERAMIATIYSTKS
jgi:hypothetical protein